MDPEDKNPRLKLRGLKAACEKRGVRLNYYNDEDEGESDDEDEGESDAGIPDYGHPGLTPPHHHQPTYPGTQQQPMAEQQLAPPQVTLMLDYMLVNVPPNVHTGMPMVVMTPTGQKHFVVVPQGAGPGSQFQIAVPRSEMVPSQ